MGVSVTARNVPERVTGTVKVVKTDAKTGRPLKGAKFQLWRETNGVPGLQTRGKDRDLRVGSPCVTDNRGICAFGDLALGTYYLRETSVPKGYVLPSHPVTGPYRLTPEHSAVEVELSNKRGKHGHGDGKEKPHGKDDRHGGI
ncbi:MSCRAMM family protein [Streptomyces pacificus]|uniref:MSCRAMM family protein n=1 Tax=Streptomyces pacificus TaxID=2705029 RepID=UPI0015657E9E|nr:prealbumin-like fold domain-containing protein [Streptomyces pacificus]